MARLIHRKDDCGVETISEQEYFDKEIRTLLNNFKIKVEYEMRRQELQLKAIDELIEEFNQIISERNRSIPVKEASP